MAKRKGLGRGLDALLGTTVTQPIVDEARQLTELPVDRIERGPYQPRTEFDPERLEELAQSIKAQGVVQPVVVRPKADGLHYELIAGERRWRAAQLAGLSDIPAVVRDVADEAVLAMALIENIQREDLNPVEEARAIKRLIEEFELTHQGAADSVGRSRASVSNLLRLLELNGDVLNLLEKGALEMGHARALLGLDGGDQSRAAMDVVAKSLSARQTEALVRQMKAGPTSATKKPTTEDPDIRRFQTDLSDQLGAPVKIEHRRGGKGRLVIEYSSLEQLDGIVGRIK